MNIEPQAFIIRFCVGGVEEGSEEGKIDGDERC